jgi:hypothetical protein
MARAAGISIKIKVSFGILYVPQIHSFVNTFAERTRSKSSSFSKTISKVIQNGPSFLELINLTKTTLTEH